MALFRSSIVIMAVFLASTTCAQQGVTAQAEYGDVTLDSLIVEAMTSNTEILSAKNAFHAARARIPQAASLNDPLVEFEYDKTASDTAMQTLAVSQDVPFPTKIYLRARIASAFAKSAYEMYKAKEREVIARIKTAYAELFLIERSLEIAVENKAVLEQLEKTANARYASNTGLQTDALKAQVELARTENDLITLAQRRTTARARLNVLMGRDPAVEFGAISPIPPMTFAYSREDLLARAREHNQELRSYRYALERGKLAYDLSLNEFLPDFNLKYKQLVEGERDTGGSWSGMVGATVPLWFIQKQIFGVKEMKSDLAMLENEYKGKENEVLFAVSDAYARVDANRKLVELYETAFIPQAEQAANVAIKTYETQKTDLLTVLDSERMVISFKKDHYQAILDLQVAVADLERAVGEE